MQSMHESARTFILNTRPQSELDLKTKVETPAQPELAHAK
jgi:hypothetical protein